MMGGNPERTPYFICRLVAFTTFRVWHSDAFYRLCEATLCEESKSGGKEKEGKQRKYYELAVCLPPRLPDRPGVSPPNPREQLVLVGHSATRPRRRPQASNRNK